MAVLDELKILKDIETSDTSQDNKLNLYIRRAVTAISVYLNIPTVVQADKYKSASYKVVSEDYPDNGDTVTTDDGITTTSTPVDIQAAYPDAVIQYVLEALNRQGDEGVKASNVSSVQNTYELGISETVKALLPTPYATMIDTYHNSDYYNDGNYDDYDGYY